MSRRAAADTTRLYSILGVDKDVSQSQLKKTYYKLAKELHPDKHPNDQEALKKFQEVTHAYEILSNPEKRSLYDQYGEEGLQGGGASDATSFFDHLFGGDPFGRSGKRGPQKGDDIVFNLGVTLKDLYIGVTKKLKVKKRIVCDKCGGKGCKGGASPKTCSGCNGNGVKITRKQIGPGMVQQMQSHCNDCQGKGEIIDKKDQCGSCSGKKTVENESIIEVYVDKGMQEGQKITFSGEGDQSPGITPGDIVIVLKLKQSETPFERSGEDLIMTKKINLLESLTGFEFSLTHLDDRVLVIKTKPGEVTSPNQIRVIPNEGMPKHKNPFIKGNLYIKFHVQFPDSHTLTKKQIDHLTRALPAKHSIGSVPMDHEEYFAEVYDETKHAKSKNNGRQEAYEDEDGDSHSRTQTCVHQ